ncbi:MAG: flagellar basal body L-ring protein FlgH [Betaproteobacteria bacterium]|jgi:flagellar L-ring protein precursor FlgH|nr:flagellar basal body L-ring protein FlgH [Betaproteobacteria bacterium]
MSLIRNWTLSALAIGLLAGCATADKKPLVEGPTSIVPPSQSAAPANAGSLFPTVSTNAGGYRPLFEDRRARHVGDTITVVLNERTTANRSSNASASKEATAEITSDLSALSGLQGAVKGLPGSGLARSAIGKVQQAGEAFNVTAEGAVDFAGKGAASAQNAFSGTITGTVLEVLANGNLVVGGEKQLAVSAEEEIIRFKGVVNPSDLVNNSITSSKVADLRLEYRGRGAGDDAQKPGWLTGLFLKVSPF